MSYAAVAPGSVWIWRPSNAVVGEMFKTLVSEFESGAEQRRDKWDGSRITVRMQFDRGTLIIDEIADMWRFYRFQRGRYGSFLLPTYAEITRLASNYNSALSSTTLWVGQTMDFCSDLRSHFGRFYVENNRGEFDFFAVANILGSMSVLTSATAVYSYVTGDVVYPVVKARFADEIFGVDHLAALIATVGVAFTEVHS